MIAVYRLMSAAVVWLALVPLEIVRILTGRSSWRDLGERLGQPVDGAGRILVHAVSVGEVHAAASLIRELSPAEVVLSVGNRDGRAAAERLQRQTPSVKAVTYLPWDSRGAVLRWLGSSRPAAIVIVETEIWPNLFFVAKGLGIPLLLLSARIYPRDVRRYRLARRFFAGVLGCASVVGAQNEEEKRRLVAIGCPSERIQVTGNLKFGSWGGGPEWSPGRERSILAVSTHRGEETLLLRIFEHLRESWPDLKLVIAPRHVSRAGDVIRLGRRSGLETAAWPGPAAVEVVGEVGRLPEVYSTAQVVFVGGTLVSHGGHNPLEAIRHGCAVVIGPHTAHVEDLLAPLREARAIVEARDADGVERELRTLLSSSQQRAALCSRAIAAIAKEEPVAERCAALVTRLLTR